MEKTHAFPDSFNFSIAKFPGLTLTVRFAKMDDSAMVAGSIKGLKNILGDAVAGITSESEARKVLLEKIGRYEAGSIGDGVARVSELEKALRGIMEKWLVSGGAKKTDAVKKAAEDSVETTFRGICAAKNYTQDSIDATWADWMRRANKSLEVLAEGPPLLVEGPTPEASPAVDAPAAD